MVLVVAELVEMAEQGPELVHTTDHRLEHLGLDILAVVKLALLALPRRAMCIQDSTLDSRRMDNRHLVRNKVLHTD